MTLALGAYSQKELTLSCRIHDPKLCGQLWIILHNSGWYTSCSQGQNQPNRGGMSSINQILCIWKYFLTMWGKYLCLPMLSSSNFFGWYASSWKFWNIASGSSVTSNLIISSVSWWLNKWNFFESCQHPISMFSSNHD